MGRFYALLPRLACVVAGAFLITCGISLSVKANLGVMALSTTPYALSLILGIEMGVCLFLYYTVLVLLEIPILRRQFTARHLLSIPFGMLVSLFIPLTGRLFAFPTPENYALKLLILCLGIVSLAVGAYITVEANLVMNAPESFTKAVAQATGKPFHFIKILVDCGLVALAALLGLLFLGRVEGIREGTLLSAVLIGRVIGWLPKSFKRAVRRFCYGRQGEGTPPDAAAV